MNHPDFQSMLAAFKTFKDKEEEAARAREGQLNERLLSTTSG